MASASNSKAIKGAILMGAEEARKEISYCCVVFRLIGIVH
jgi:hypothetical protein